MEFSNKRTKLATNSYLLYSWLWRKLPLNRSSPSILGTLAVTSVPVATMTLSNTLGEASPSTKRAHLVPSSVLVKELTEALKTILFKRSKCFA